MHFNFEDSPSDVSFLPRFPLCFSIENFKFALILYKMFGGQLRVDLTGKETDTVFEKILRNLARTAPPVPGFRREKGGNYLYTFFFQF